MPGMARPNRLIRESSPYLLQHAENPVDWYAWSDEAFERARTEDKPVLLSVGYSSCHWCHVMERESFADPDVASIMNRFFVCVKVDREERPDVDDLYMRAVQLLTGRGGWPMTVFLTPDRQPFHGGTYFPPTDRHGLPAFPRVLEAVARAYRERRSEVLRSAAQLARGIVELDVSAVTSGNLDVGLPRRSAAALAEHVDDVYGGLGGAPKFPNAPAFRLLLRRGHLDGAASLVDAALLTCRRMAEGGMYDQVGGGFHRYSVDQRWLVPHFEKMLYDNALLPRLYLDAWQVSGDGTFARVVEETIEYVLREMQDESGGFHSATDADSEGEEGRFFVWTPEQVRAVLPGADADLVCRYWGISSEGNFEGASIAHVTMSMDDVARAFGLDTTAAAEVLVRSRALLYAARSRRVPPLRDDKVLAGWNGLMLGTLARAGQVLSNPGWIGAAIRNADFLWTSMRKDDRLMHTWIGGRAKIPAFLDDHVFVAEGLVALYEATGDVLHLDRARALVGDLERHFHDPEGGGYFFTPDDGEALLTRSKPAVDGAIPSGNGAAAHLLLRLHALTGDPLLRERAEEILRLYHAAAARNPFGFVSYLEALEIWGGEATDIVVIGDPSDDRDALLAAANASFVPHAMLITAAPGAGWVPVPARDRQMVGGRATAYVCQGFTCSPPATDPGALRAALKAPRA
jgi:uncharacterized protein YyaL (SSP411 family)